MNCKIVPIAEEHIEGFWSALDIVSRERKYLAFLEGPPMEGTRAFVQGNIKNGHPQFVALVDGKVVGWCDISPKDRPIMKHSGVLGIGLLPEYRNQGIGRKLMQATIDAARAKGLTRIELGVREHNENAIALYKKLGFEIEGRQKNVYRIDGKYEDNYIMALLS